MSIAVTITAGGVAYDCSDYVIRHSIEIDEYLFSPDSLKPNTNKATLVLSRTCPYIDEILAATGDISIAISSGGVAAFTGYLTDNFGIGISSRGMGDMAITAEDPGIKLLKKPWASTGGLWTDLTGKKVCDPADTGNSFVHILAALAGATVAAGAPTVTNLVYFSVQDKDKKQYWDVLEKVLYDYGYVFYFNASGELALYSLAALTGTPSLTVRSDATILQKSLGDAGIEIRKRFIQYQEAVINYREAETVSSAVVFRDTTNQGLTDCDIEIAAGVYYPDSADASTYAYIDYFLEDGRDILAMTSAASDFVVDSGITYEFTHLGKSAKIRFYNPTALPKHIRKLKVTGSGVVVVKAESTMTSNEGGGKKLEYDADYLTANADAQSLANLLRYVYANSTSLYNFRACHGVLYPADDLYPSTTLYPLGDTLTIGSLVNLLDPVWTSLNVNCAIYRKKYQLGRDGASYEALGIGSINLADTTARRPIAVPNARPIVGLYPTEKAIASTSDTVDFDGQYGVYEGQRYVGAKPATWTLDDAGQTPEDVAALVPFYAPSYLGAFKDSQPGSAKEGDVYLRYSATANTVDPPTIDDPPDKRGVFKYTSGTWVWTSDPADMYKAIRDIVDICGLLNTATPPTALYGVEADYGVTSTIESAHIKTAMIDYLRGGNAYFEGDINANGGTFRGTLNTPILQTQESQPAGNVTVPTPSYWPTAQLFTNFSGLPDGWTAVTSASSYDGLSITHLVKASSSAVAFQADDTEESGSGTSYSTIKTITSAVSGSCYISAKQRSYNTIYGEIGEVYARILVNGVVVASHTISTYTYTEFGATFSLSPGDTIVLQARGRSYWPFTSTWKAKELRISPASGAMGLWISGGAGYVINSGDYSNKTTLLYVAPSSFESTSYDDYWLGLDYINAFDSKISPYVTQDVDGGTWSVGTPASVFIAGNNSMTVSYASGSPTTINAAGYYNYTGYITLVDTEPVVLLGDDTLGRHEIWPHNIPGTDKGLITLRNTNTSEGFSIFEVRNPTIDADAWAPSTAYLVNTVVINGAYFYRCTTAGTSASSGGPTGTSTSTPVVDGTAQWVYVGTESTLSLHNYPDPAGRDWVRDISFHNYSGNMHGIDVIYNFTDTTTADWKWVKVLVGTETMLMRLYGATGNLWIKGNLSADGTVQPAGGYKSADGSTGATGTFTTADSKTVTVKNGIITSIV